MRIDTHLPRAGEAVEGVGDAGEGILVRSDFELIRGGTYELLVVPSVSVDIFDDAEWLSYRYWILIEKHHGREWRPRTLSDEEIFG